MIERIKTSLVFKTALLFLVAAIVPYALVMTVFYQSTKTALKAEIVKAVHARTDLIRDNMDSRLALLRSNAAAWAGQGEMDDILADDLDKRITSALVGLKKNYSLTGDIHVVNRRGRVVASTSPLAMGRDMGGEWLDRTLGGEAVERDMHASLLDSRPAILFAVPARASFEQSRIIGALVLEYDPKDLEGLFHALDAPHVAIFARDGRVVASTDDRLFKDRSGPRAWDLPGYIAAQAESRGGYGFKGFGWRVMAAVGEDSAMEPVRELERVTLLAGLLGIFLIAGLVSFFSQRIVRPLKELSITAEHIARTKDLGLKANVRGRDEVASLAHAFNHMVSEVRLHIERVKEMEEHLRRSDRLSALGEMSAGISHEIKNPLGAIKAAADILRQKLVADESMGTLVAIISDEAMRLSKLLDSLLEFARPRPRQVMPMNANEVIEKALALLSGEMKKADVALEKELDRALPPIEADPDQLYQAFINVIINALQAMPSGGALCIKTRLLKTASPEGSHGEFVEVAIADTGTGIAMEHRDRIFDPFFTTKDKGTGLGLAIVYRIIAGFRGFIKIEDSPGGGTVFRIYLPLNQGGPA